MDDWATRFPTNTADVARVLIDLAGALLGFTLVPSLLLLTLDCTDLAQQQRLPSILHFSAQEPMTKFDIATLFASLHSPPFDTTKYLESDAKGPQPGDTVRPRDCHLSNVSFSTSSPVYRDSPRYHDISALSRRSESIVKR